MLFDDPEAPTTIRRRFHYPVLTGGQVTGSVAIDAGSVVSLDPRQPAVTGPAAAAGARRRRRADVPGRRPVPAKRGLQLPGRRPAAARPPATPLAVMGPQLGYYYPEIVQQIHLSGPGIEAQGVAVPGLAMYLLIGRTQDYAWSLTSAEPRRARRLRRGAVRARRLGAHRESDHYLFEGECRPFEIFDAGTLNGTPIRYPARCTDRSSAPPPPTAGPSPSPGSARPSVATA